MAVPEELSTKLFPRYTDDRIFHELESSESNEMVM